MSKKRIIRKCDELSEKSRRLYLRAKHGFLTEDEKRRKCNELAHDYLCLSTACKNHFKGRNPIAANYLETACINLATDLKLLAATSEKKSARKGPEIKRKVITYPKMERRQ